MSRLDEALRDAMKREEAPEGFAGRVMARVQRAERAQREAPVKAPAAGWFAWFSGPRLRWAAGFAAMALTIGMGFEVKQQRDRERGERAKEQLMVALRITGGKLRMAQAKVLELEQAPIEQRY